MIFSGTSTSCSKARNRVQQPFSGTKRPANSTYLLPPGTCGSGGGRTDKIRSDKQLRFRNTYFQHFGFEKWREADEGGYFVNHSCKTVQPQGESVQCAQTITIFIAAPYHCIKVVAEFASLTNFPLSIEKTVRAVGAEAVEHLYGRNPQFVKSVISRGRNQWINIVNESDVGFEPFDDTFNLSAAIPRINSLREEQGALCNAEILSLFVAACEKIHFLPMLFEEFDLGIDYGIFAAEVLIKAVDQ